MYNNHETAATRSAAARKADIAARQAREARNNRWAKAAIYAMMVLLAAAIVYSRWLEWRGRL